MPSLQSLRRKISAFKNTQKITKAMKMVAASKLRRAQENVVAARPYADKLMQVVGDVASRLSPDDLQKFPLARRHPDPKKVLLVVDVYLFVTDLIVASQSCVLMEYGKRLDFLRKTKPVQQILDMYS